MNKYKFSGFWYNNDIWTAAANAPKLQQDFGERRRVVAEFGRERLIR